MLFQKDAKEEHHSSDVDTPDTPTDHTPTDDTLDGSATPATPVDGSANGSADAPVDAEVVDAEVVDEPAADDDQRNATTADTVVIDEPVDSYATDADFSGADAEGRADADADLDDDVDGSDRRPLPDDLVDEEREEGQDGPAVIGGGADDLSDYNPDDDDLSDEDNAADPSAAVTLAEPAEAAPDTTWSDDAARTDAIVDTSVDGTDDTPVDGTAVGYPAEDPTAAYQSPDGTEPEPEPAYTAEPVSAETTEYTPVDDTVAGPVDEPAVDEQVVDAPVVVADSPVDEPVAGEPVADASVAEVPVADASADEVPVAAVPTELLPGGVTSEPAPVGWTDEDTQGFRDRWREVQLRFVDDPRGAAAEAGDLVGEAVDKLTAALAAQRADLDSWQSSEGDDTEIFRVAVRSYRDLLDKILAA